MSDWKEAANSGDFGWDFDMDFIPRRQLHNQWGYFIREDEANFIIRSVDPASFVIGAISGQGSTPVHDRGI